MCLISTHNFNVKKPRDSRISLLIFFYWKLRILMINYFLIFLPLGKFWRVISLSFGLLHELPQGVINILVSLSILFYLFYSFYSSTFSNFSKFETYYVYNKNNNKLYCKKSNSRQVTKAWNDSTGAELKKRKWIWERDI